MNTTLRALPAALLFSLAGCVVAVKSNGNPQDPAPAPAPVHGPGRTVSEDVMRKYLKKVPEVFEASKQVIRSRGLQITGDSTPGDDNWTLNATRGREAVRIFYNRKDHKTRTTVHVTLTGNVTDSDAKRVAYEYHEALGRVLGEQGDD